MRRPNPWVALPSLGGGLLAAWLGWVVTDLSCRQVQPDGTVAGCPGWSAAVAVIAFLVALVGMAVVVVLVYRSLAEWRQAETKGR